MGKKLITLKIDNRPVTVPEGTLVVDAARKVGVDIPVFCYHPKLLPVGMCRMCLVDIGRPMIDRATGQPVLEADGSPKIQFGPKLDTGCTTPVSEGMVVVTESEKVLDARKDVIEFLLTSHPLDCPVCDKGGECPLQNLTMKHGTAQSRFILNEKHHGGKHVPLGELIYLDRERCIQCGRCTRFQHEIVDDPVIGFFQRGRNLEIVTDSEPGFNSIWSGNSTDICPVGALTTVDFHFGARPWEMNTAASVCNQCPVGCNIVYNVRREAKAGGATVIKRVMPRQNEAVNEIWMCDKGRFTYHYAESTKRLLKPLVRKGGELKEATWDEALALTAEKLRAAGSSLVTLAGGRLSNEDLFNLAQVTGAQGGQAALYSYMAGGDLTAQVGLAQGCNFGEMGKGAVILVVASDLHEEAPLWWLRIKQATERGATLIVLNPRETRLDKFAKHVLHYTYGQEAATLGAFLPGADVAVSESLKAAVEAFAAAENAVVLFGSEGLGLEGSQAVAQTAARLLVESGHVGRPNNGLVGVWPNGNTQGAWDAGFRPQVDLAGALRKAGAAWIAAADPAGDDPALAAALQETGFVVVQELTLTETARLADVVLPALPPTEREGSYTSGERRVQRYYPAVPARAEARADFEIAAAVGSALGVDVEGRAAALVLRRMADTLEAYRGLTYQKLAESPEQWPPVGREDVYYGGTTYDNHQGVGVQLPLLAGQPVLTPVAAPQLPAGDGLLVVPVTRLYDRGATVLPSQLLNLRMAPVALWLHPQTAESLGLADGDMVQLTLSGAAAAAGVRLSADVPAGVALLPRSVGLPISAPVTVRLQREQTGG